MNSDNNISRYQYLSHEQKESINKGLQYLALNQRNSGEFNSYRSTDPFFLSERQFDSSIFPTALITYCLSFFDTSKSRKMITKACHFLANEMHEGAIWRYWTRENPFHTLIPPDLDDTALVSVILKKNGFNFPCNRSVLLGNRNSKGLFYTWIAPRLDIPRSCSNFAQVIKSSINPIQLYYFWKNNESKPKDIDSVVCANVVFYLGECHETKKCIEYLIKILLEGSEGQSDKWHLNPYNLYYAISRNYAAGMKSFESIRPTIINRILSTECNTQNVLDNALALCSLHNLNYTNSEHLSEYSEAILKTQRKDGAWPALPHYWGGPQKYVAWGSEEITTAYCLEALNRLRL